MALIEDGNPAAGMSSRDFWLDDLQNKRILYFNLEKAINALQKKEVHSYTIDTGQDHQTVTRHDLPQLYTQLLALRKDIEEQEENLGVVVREKSHQAVPLW